MQQESPFQGKRYHPSETGVLTSEETNIQTAAILLHIGSLFYYKDKPFKFDSGIFSPLYLDNRLIISNPTSRDIIVENLIEKINKIDSPDVIAGVATAGIPYAAFIAQKLELPMVYARPYPKEHGKQNQVEGQIKPGQKVLVVEDTISTARSSVRAVEALRKKGAHVTDEITIFTYDMKESKENLKDAKVKLHVLTNLESVVRVALEIGYLNEVQVRVINNWSQNPINWGR